MKLVVFLALVAISYGLRVTGRRHHHVAHSALHSTDNAPRVGTVQSFTDCGTYTCTKIDATGWQPNVVKGSPPPVGYEAFRGTVPNLNCIARKFLTGNVADIGQLTLFTVNKRQLAARLEWHHDNHPARPPQYKAYEGPDFWHPGASIFQIRTNALLSDAQCASSSSAADLSAATLASLPSPTAPRTPAPATRATPTATSPAATTTPASSSGGSGGVVDVSSCHPPACSKVYATERGSGSASSPPVGYLRITRVSDIPNAGCIAMKFLSGATGDTTKFVLGGRQLTARVENNAEKKEVVLYSIIGNAQLTVDQCAALA